MHIVSLILFCHPENSPLVRNVFTVSLLSPDTNQQNYFVVDGWSLPQFCHIDLSVSLSSRRGSRISMCHYHLPSHDFHIHCTAAGCTKINCHRLFIRGCLAYPIVEFDDILLTDGNISARFTTGRLQMTLCHVTNISDLRQCISIFIFARAFTQYTRYIDIIITNEFAGHTTHGNRNPCADCLIINKYR